MNGAGESSRNAATSTGSPSAGTPNRAARQHWRCRTVSAGGLRTWAAVGSAPLTGKSGPRYEVGVGERAREAHRRCAAMGRIRGGPSATPACRGYPLEFPSTALSTACGPPRAPHRHPSGRERVCLACRILFVAVPPTTLAPTLNIAGEQVTVLASGEATEGDEVFLQRGPEGRSRHHAANRSLTGRASEIVRQPQRSGGALTPHGDKLPRNTDRHARRPHPATLPRRRAARAGDPEVGAPLRAEPIARSLAG